MTFKDLKIGDWFSAIDDINTTYILAENKLAYEIEGENIGQSFIFFDNAVVLPKDNISVNDTTEEYVLEDSGIDPEAMSAPRIMSGKIINITDTVEPYVNGEYLTCPNGKLIYISFDKESKAAGNHYIGQVLDRKKLKLKFFTYGFYINDMPTLYRREFTE